MKTNDKSRSFEIVAADPDTKHCLIEAALAAAVSLAWMYADSPVSAWIWSLLAVGLVGLAWKSANRAIDQARIDMLETDLICAQADLEIERAKNAGEIGSGAAVG